MKKIGDNSIKKVEYLRIEPIVPIPEMYFQNDVLKTKIKEPSSILRKKNTDFSKLIKDYDKKESCKKDAIVVCNNSINYLLNNNTDLLYQLEMDLLAIRINKDKIK